FLTHRDFGYLFGLLTLVLLALAFIGRMPRPWIGMAALLLGLFTLQSVLVALRTDLPAVAALHPLNGWRSFSSRCGSLVSGRNPLPVGQHNL
ncbi:MAG: DUF6220 domain-containing protein, partial [Candidatus Limnocylindrales bacterium]